MTRKRLSIFFCTILEEKIDFFMYIEFPKAQGLEYINLIANYEKAGPFLDLKF